MSGSAEGLPPEPEGPTDILSPEQSRSLQIDPHEYVDSLYRSLKSCGRLFLLEVACGEDSLLSAAAEKQGLRAFRAGLHNRHDITDLGGLRRVLDVIRKERPQNVWLSTECSAFSPMQNLNQRNQQQVAELHRKQREARKQHIAGLVIAYWARHWGAEVHWEWSHRCRAWKWDLMDRYRYLQNTHTCIVGGCRVGLHDPKTGNVIGKEWRVETTSESFAKGFHMPCQGQQCQGNHTACEGSLTRASAFYTPKFASRAVFYMQKLSSVMSHCQQMNMSQCQCREFRFKGQSQTCPHCLYEWLPPLQQDLRSTAAAPTSTNNKRDLEASEQDLEHSWAQESSDIPFTPQEKEH